MGAYCMHTHNWTLSVNTHIHTHTAWEYITVNTRQNILSKKMSFAFQTVVLLCSDSNVFPWKHCSHLFLQICMYIHICMCKSWNKLPSTILLIFQEVFFSKCARNDLSPASQMWIFVGFLSFLGELIEHICILDCCSDKIQQFELQEIIMGIFFFF